MGEYSIKKSTLSTLVVMVSTFVSRLFGFVRIAVIGAVFGASGDADVLNAVFTIPNNLRKLMAEGALSSAFIPVLSKSLIADSSGERAKKIVRNIIALQFIVIVPLLLISVIFTPSVVRLILDFPEPERAVLASRLFRWMIHYLLLVSISAVIMGVINTQSSFLIPAVTPILFSVSVISSVIFFHKSMGPFSMVVGVLAGGLVQIIFQLPKLKSYGYDLRLDFDFRNPDFIRVIRQWLPVVVTASVYTINEQIAIRFATALEDGSTSAMSNALVFWQLPFGIFSASITTVLFPRMSRQAAQDDREGLKNTLEYGFRYLVILLVPSAVILSLLSREVVSVALQRGNFIAVNTLLTSKVLVGFNLGLLSVGAFNFFQRFFYSFDDYKTPLISAVLVCALDIGLSLWLKETSLRVTGLALANSLSFTAGLGLLYYQASKKLGGLGEKRVIITLVKTILSVIPPAAFILIFIRLTGGDWWQSGSTFRNLGLLTLAGSGSAVLLFLMYRIMKIDIFMNLLRKEVKM